ncbi:MAG: hypothetical protein MUC58_11555 [Rhizobiaceae bacterium]|jgi:hypothetical protein|nr:hypothetical protein [Rhizobiaceae bacterium]
MTTGYSDKPLASKLGFCGPVFAFGMPEAVKAEIEGGQLILWAARLDNARDAHLFVTLRAELAEMLTAARAALPDIAAVWVSWPKKSSKVATDITEDVIRDIALPMGWVDVKVCAVDAVWSGLKLVVRKELRSRAA